MLNHRVKDTPIDNEPYLHVCNIHLLHKINVDTYLIQHNYLFNFVFDNVGRQMLGTITLPIIVGHVTLPMPIHVIIDTLSHNLLLGRPWIHAMQAISSTLYHTIKLIHGGKIWIMEVDKDPYSGV